jgi:hypothetical protein
MLCTTLERTHTRYTLGCEQMFMIGGHVILKAVAGFVDLAAGGALVPTPQHVQAGHVVFQDVLSLAHLSSGRPAITFREEGRQKRPGVVKKSG